MKHTKMIVLAIVAVVAIGSVGAVVYTNMLKQNNEVVVHYDEPECTVNNGTFDVIPGVPHADGISMSDMETLVRNSEYISSFNEIKTKGQKQIDDAAGSYRTSIQELYRQLDKKANETGIDERVVYNAHWVGWNDVERARHVESVNVLVDDENVLTFFVRALNVFENDLEKYTTADTLLHLEVLSHSPVTPLMLQNGYALTYENYMELARCERQIEYLGEGYNYQTGMIEKHYSYPESEIYPQEFLEAMLKLETEQHYDLMLGWFTPSGHWYGPFAQYLSEIDTAESHIESTREKIDLFLSHTAEPYKSELAGIIADIERLQEEYRTTVNGINSSCTEEVRNLQLSMINQ